MTENNSENTTENSGRPLEGQIALVTGASRGIGAATAKKLAEQGAHVILTARTAGGLEEVEEHIHKAGGSATIAPMDLTESESIARLAAAMRERWQSLDILVMNAAMLGELTPVTMLDGKNLNKLLTLNLIANQVLLANLDSMLKRADNGRVFALTSSVARTPRAFWSGYSASKAALENMVLSYGQEVRNLGNITTAIIDPGKTRTKMRAQAYPGEDPHQLKEPETVAQAILDLAINGFDDGHFAQVKG